MVAYIVLNFSRECQSVVVLIVTLRSNKALRNFGIYTLRTETLILLKRSEELSFLFSEANWQWHGPVNYRVSHGDIYCRGESTGLTDEDLIDTGNTWDAFKSSILFNREQQ
jgi:hypothetical protein